MCKLYADAPYNARVQAARDILSYSHGKPGQARPIAVTDIAAMSEEQRQELLYALLNHYMPSGFQSLLEQACNEAVEQYEQSLIQHHQPRRFQRSGDAALPPPSTHEESAIPATLEARSAARAMRMAMSIPAFRRHLRRQRLAPRSPHPMHRQTGSRTR